ncbi:restriction endonuclease subunit S [Janthinobacterium sp. PC23-8]|uniref:restriction endonuclease subunit S n=1 Tax=Janthinobacterium sp. PC23-8 TaxID=2012679 RepID=UPI000B9605C8|nr:restriction endonuclease subunit S [Janthinobacterium sp. PC23-8]OYO30563.1 hypothetical protein CD932_05010 [Janthinobacterium sp. PC23-8]
MNAVQQLLTDHIDIWTAAETEKKSGRGRAAGNAASVYGIKKLRELILDLAVRGKLVPQDANDKSASELFTRIEAEKTKLIAEGRVKKNKPLSAISDDDQPFPLPLEWTWLRLEDLMPQFQNGASSRGDVDGEAVVVLRLADIKDRRIVLEDPRELLITPSLIGKYHLSKNDILIVRVNGSSDLVGGFIVCEGNFNGIYCDHFIRMKVPQNIMNSNFLGLIGSSGLIRNRINDLFITTAGQKTVNQGHISSLLVPVPSIAEQHRIVAKVDELMALCDQLEAQHSDAADAHEQLVSHLLDTLTQSQSAADFNANWQRIAAHFDTLFTTEASIEALKQTLLQLAVMGKLVAQDANDEPASELLKRIEAKKAKLISEGKIKKEKMLATISEDEKPFDLPANWEWVRLGKLVEKSGAGWSPSCEGHAREGDSWGVLKVSAVSWGKFLPNENKALPKTLEPRLDCVVESGDFLITRANTDELVARSVVVENCPPNLMLSDKIVRLRLSLLCSNKFINLVNLSPFSRNYYALAAGGTSSSMKNVTREQILNLVAGTPPLAEQHRIVAKVDELMEFCDRLKSRITATNQQQKKLADVLVEHAVAG